MRSRRIGQAKREMDDESQNGQRFKFPPSSSPLLIHQTEGKGSGGWIRSLRLSRRTTFAYQICPEGPLLPSLNRSYFPNKVYNPCGAVHRHGQTLGGGLRLRARHKRKGKEWAQGRVLVEVVVVGYLWWDVPCAMMGGCCAGTREVREVFALFLFLIVLRRVLMGWPPPPPPPPRLVRLVTDLVKVERVCLACFVGSGVGRSRAKDGRGGTSLCLGPFGTVRWRRGGEEGWLRCIIRYRRVSHHYLKL